MTATGFNPANFDVRLIDLPDMPPEWDPVDEELRAFLQPDENGLFSPEQIQVEEAIASKRWFLVANTLAWRCKRCRSGPLRSPGSLGGTVHPYISYHCLPRPFNGLNEVLMFWKERLGEVSYDSWTMRLGENIIPITRQKAREMYLNIEMVSKKDLAWFDYWARYKRRYKEYLRSMIWDPATVTDEQWKLVMKAAHREYLAFLEDEIRLEAMERR